MKGYRHTRKRKCIQLSDRNYRPLDLTCVVDFMYHASVTTNYKKHTLFPTYGSDGKRKVIPRLIFLSLCKQIGIDPTKTLSTPVFKQAMRAYILSHKKPVLFGILTYILENHRKLYTNGKGFRLNDKSGLVLDIFNVLDFKYTSCGIRRGDCAFLVKKATVYINGQWIHIG
jgi:hypothetical protein